MNPHTRFMQKAKVQAQEDIESSDGEQTVTKNCRVGVLSYRTPLAPTTGDGRRLEFTSEKANPVDHVTDLEANIQHDLRTTKMKDIIGDCIVVDDQRRDLRTLQKEEEQRAKRLMGQTDNVQSPGEARLRDLDAKLEERMSRINEAAGNLSLQERPLYQEKMKQVHDKLGVFFSTQAIARSEEDRLLAEQLDEANGMRVELESQITELTLLNDKLVSENTDLKQQKQETRCEAVAAASARDQLTTQLQEVTCDKGKLQIRIDSAEERYHRLDERLSTVFRGRDGLSETLHRLEVQLASVVKERDDLQETVDDHDVQRADIACELDGLKDGLGKAELELGSVIKQRNSLEEDLQATKSTLADLSDRDKKSSAINVELRSRIASAYGERDQIHAQLTEEVRCKVAQQALFDNAEHYNQELQSEVASLKRASNESRSLKSLLQMRCDQGEREKSVMKERIANSEKQNREHEARYTSLTLERDDLKVRDSKLELKHNETMIAHAILEEKSIGLEGQIEECNLQMSSLREKCNELQNRNCSLDRTNNALRSGKARSEERIKDMQENKRNAERSIGAMRKESDELTAKFADLEKQHKGLKGCLGQVRDEYNDVRVGRDHLSKELDVVRMDRNSKSLSLQGLNSAYSILEADFRTCMGMSTVGAADWGRHDIVAKQVGTGWRVGPVIIDWKTSRVFGREIVPAANASEVQHQAFQLLCRSKRNYLEPQRLLDLWCGFEQLGEEDMQASPTLPSIIFQVVGQMLDFHPGWSVTCWIGILFRHCMLPSQGKLLSQTTDCEDNVSANTTLQLSTSTPQPGELLVNIIARRLREQHDERLLKAECEVVSGDMFGIWFEDFPDSSQLLVIASNGGPPWFALWDICQVRVFLYRLRHWLAFLKCDGRMAMLWRVKIEDGIRVREWFESRNRFEPKPQDLNTCAASWYNDR
jgi:hypothetical protein